MSRINGILINFRILIDHFFTMSSPLFLFVGLSPRVQHNGSNTLPRASHHSTVSESPVKHGSSLSQRSQIVGPSVPGSNGSRRNSNSGGMQTPCGNVTDSGTPSSTPSVPRRCSVGVDGTTKGNARGN